MSEKITDRLRCRYALGPIMPNGEPEFGWRDFSGPALEGMVLPTPIMLEAAKAIDAKDAEIVRLRKAIVDLISADNHQDYGKALHDARTALTQQEQGNGSNPT